MHRGDGLGFGIGAHSVAMAVSLTLALSPAVSLAAPTEAKSVVTLPVHVQGELGVDLRRELDAGVADGLARGKFDVVAVDDSCAETRCFTALAKREGAAFIVRTVVTIEDRNYAVALSLVDGKTGSTTAEATDVCDVCGLQEVREIIADQAATLRTRLDALVAGAPMAVVTSTPSEALVTMDGETVGQTPLRRELTAGTHVARVQKEGYVTVEREFLAVAGVEERLDFELPPLPDIRPRFRPWGWIGVGVGAGSITAGVTFLVLDERPAPGDRCQGDNVDADGNCRFRYDTLAAGLIFATAGGVLALAGTAVLVAMRPRRGPPRRRRTTWRPHGLGVTGRF